MIYENVRRLANKKDMSICKLERNAGLQNGTIGKWRTSSPNVSSIKAVADVLGVTVDVLIREDGADAVQEGGANDVK